MGAAASTGVAAAATAASEAELKNALAGISADDKKKLLAALDGGAEENGHQVIQPKIDAAKPKWAELNAKGTAPTAGTAFPVALVADQDEASAGEGGWCSFLRYGKLVYHGASGEKSYTVDLPGEGTVLVEETSGVAYAEAARVDPPASSTLPLPSSRPDRGSSALPWVLVASVLGFAAGRLQPRAFRVEKRNASPAALARLPGETGGFSQVRDSGPEEMRDPEPDWSEIDEAIDESFPASDPPAWSAPRRDYPAAGQRASSSIAHGASSEGASASGGRAALLGYGLAGAALAALGLSLARGSAMDRNDIGYPPLDQPKPVAPDVWIVDSGPVNAMGLKLPIRMTIVRLKNGDVLLHSPTRHTPALAEAIKGIGPVRHIVAPATGRRTPGPRPSTAEVSAPEIIPTLG